MATNQQNKCQKKNKSLLKLKKIKQMNMKNKPKRSIQTAIFKFVCKK